MVHQPSTTGLPTVVVNLGEPHIGALSGVPTTARAASRNPNFATNTRSSGCQESEDIISSWSRLYHADLQVMSTAHNQRAVHDCSS